MSKRTTSEAFMDLQQDAFILFEAKNKDYGDSFREEGVLGVMIRMKDKLNRFINLARTNGEAAVPTESLRETLLDFHNYSALAIIAMDEGEPVEKAETAEEPTL